jgi:hypothetical protein
MPKGASAEFVKYIKKEIKNKVNVRKITYVLKY